MNIFDKKFGPQFFNSLPTCPGVYKIYDASSSLIYVGKAKNLRRRLGQYRNAKRRRRQKKMLKIIQAAAKISYETYTTALEAETQEAKLIQNHRPKWNIVGAFFFLYPMIGLKVEPECLTLCYTTQPEILGEALGTPYKFFGAYRSREITGEAYFALIDLLEYIGHPEKRSKQLKIPKHSYLRSFRRVPAEWESQWTDFFKGESKDLLETLILALVENAAARKRKEEVQKNLDLLARFWKHEVLPLHRAVINTGHSAYPVQQRERDLVFLNNRHLVNSQRTSRQVVPNGAPQPDSARQGLIQPL